MFLMRQLFNKKSDISAPSPVTSMTPSSKVLSMQVDGSEEDYVQINYKKLSYAEIASLSVSVEGHKIVDPTTDLNTDVTDYQLFDNYNKNKKLLSTLKSRSAESSSESAASDDSAFSDDAELPEKFKHDHRLKKMKAKKDRKRGKSN